jgi:hypothetical protein
MAIQWGSWQYGGGNGMRVGLDISWSGVTYGSTTTTATVEVWTENQYTYSDSQSINISNNLGSDFIYNNTQGGSPTKRGTRTYLYTYGANPGSVTFGATVEGTYNNISPSVSIASTTPTVPGGIGKVWNGTAYVTVLPKIWNGTAWVDAQARMWNGTEWKHGI